MRMDKLTSTFQMALAEAQSLAVGQDHQFIEPAHLMVALLAQQGSGVRGLLSKGGVNVNLGSKGIVELELVASGEKWGRGPKLDIHSSYKAMVDSPAWRLVLALNTLVTADGNTPAIDGWFENVRPLTAREQELIAEAARSGDEAGQKALLSVTHWIDDLPYAQALERLASQPTVNIEGLVAGYTGPGGKTILPGRAVAKLDLRLVPDQTRTEAVAKLRAHLDAHGFEDVEERQVALDGTGADAVDPHARAADGSRRQEVTR